MKKLTPIVIIIGLLVSCEERDSKYESENVLYYDFIPDTLIGTVKYLIPSDVPIQNCEDIPIPLDSNATLYLDINNDLTYDFYFEVKHGFGGLCQSHCTCFKYEIQLIGLNNISFVSASTINSQPLCYDSLEVIDINSNWMNSVYLHFEVGGMGEFIINDCFVGIKINNNYGWINISHSGKNGIIIKEYAINLKDNTNIKCGQKE
jgi:hypothetical protein